MLVGNGHGQKQIAYLIQTYTIKKTGPHNMQSG